MPFNPDVKRKIVRDKEDKHLPCVTCVAAYPLPDAVHIDAYSVYAVLEALEV